MTGQPPKPATAAVPADASAVSPNLFQHRRFWLRLAAYRPFLVLVGGFWVVMLAISILAYGRLTSSGVQQRAEPRSPYPHEQAQLDQAALTATPEAERTTAETTPVNDAEAPAPAGPTVSPWSLGLLVALCAGGCFTLSHSLSAPRRAPRPSGAQRRGRPATAPPSKMSPSKTAGPSMVKVRAPKAAPKRMQPYRPMPGGPGFAPAAAAQNPAAVDAAAVTVVPEESANALDWPKDSLINSLDVRQRRSVSSWLSS
jgi:hypothetical protein